MATILGDLVRKYNERSIVIEVDLLSLIAQIQLNTDVIKSALGQPLVTVLGDIVRKTRDYSELDARDYLTIIAQLQQNSDDYATLKLLPKTTILGLLVRNCQNNIKPGLTDFLSIIAQVQVIADLLLNIITPNNTLTAQSGGFTLVGNDINLAISGRLVIGTGTFNLVGSDVALNYSSTPAPYVNIPDAPTFNSPTTRIQATLLVSGELFYQDFGVANANAGGDILIGNITNGLEFNGLNGDKTHRWRLKNLDQNSVVTGAPANDVHRQTGNCNFIEVYGDKGDLIPSNFSPYKVTGGQSGFNFANATVAGTTVKYCNSRMYANTYAGMLSNLGGGSNTDGHGWNGLAYEKVLRRFCFVTGDGQEGEGFYNGHTSSPYAIIRQSISVHNGVYIKGREGEQDEHVSKVLWYNLTFRTVGQITNASQAGQKNLIQHHDNGFGIVENCIFDGAPDVFNLFLCANYTFRNCYFRWTNGLPGFIGDTATSYFGGSPRCAGGTVTFTGCTFFADNGGGTVEAAAQIAEKLTNFTFSTCKFSSNLTAITKDVSGGHSGVWTGAIGTNGNISVPYATMTAQKPSYVSSDIQSPDFLKVSTISYLTAGQGCMTAVSGDQDILEADEIPDIVVANGVAFGANGVGVGLPQNAMFLEQDGLYHLIPVTWSAGAYNGSVQGDYIISGTPTISTGIRNASGTTISTSVHVNATSANTLPVVTGTFSVSGKSTGLVYSAGTKQIVVNLGAVGMTYITGQNYNHIGQAFLTGNQSITGENASDPLTGLRKTDGVVTTYGVNIVSQFNGEGLGQNSDGIFPAAFNLSEWTNPAAGSRVFRITGLDNSKTYALKLMCSVSTSQAGTHTVDVTVAGASGGGTVTAFDQKANVNNFVNGTNGFSVVPSGGIITITITRNAGIGAISGFILEANGI